MCITVGGPVRSLKPALVPNPIAKLSVEVVVSNSIPPEMGPPDAALFVIGGVSLSGLSPTAPSVPGGDKSNLIMAA